MVEITSQKLCLKKEDCNRTSRHTILSSYEENLFRFKKKILIGCLPIIIMNKLNEISVTSPSNVILSLKRDYDIEFSPGTIYPIFKRLDIEGNITRLPNKTNRLYILTTRGKQNFEYFSANFPFILVLDELF